MLGTTGLLFVLGRRLFSARVGAVAAVIYWLHPLAVIWSPVVKTEPLNTFVATLAIYLAVRGIQSEHRERFVSFMLAGVALGVSFYVRESALAVVLAAVMIVTVGLRFGPRPVGRAYALLASGFFAVVAVIAAYFLRWMSWDWFLRSSLDPLRLPIGAVLTMSHRVATASAVTAANVAAAPRHGGQGFSVTLANIRETVALDAHLFAALAVGVLVAVVLRFRKRDQLAASALGLAVCYAWSLALLLAYGLWSIQRGFFTQYFGEVVPPLVLLSAFLLVTCGEVLLARPRPLATAALATAIALLLDFVAYRVNPMLELPRPLFVAVPALALAVPYLLDVHHPARSRGARVYPLVVAGAALAALAGFSATGLSVAKLAVTAVLVLGIALAGSARGEGRLDVYRPVAYVALVAIVATALSAFATSGRLLSLAYECILDAPDRARSVRVHPFAFTAGRRSHVGRGDLERGRGPASVYERSAPAGVRGVDITRTGGIHARPIGAFPAPCGGIGRLYVPHPARAHRRRQQLLAHALHARGDVRGIAVPGGGISVERQRRASSGGASAAVQYLRIQPFQCTAEHVDVELSLRTPTRCRSQPVAQRGVIRQAPDLRGQRAHIALRHQ